MSTPETFRVTITITPLTDAETQQVIDDIRKRFGRKPLIHVIGRQPSGTHVKDAPMAPSSSEDTPRHTHVDACMCEMYDLEVIGGRECSNCGGHDGGPCGSRCAVAHDEIVKREDPATRDSAWTDFEWPTWVPADTRSEIERFWGAKQHRNPSAWQRNSHHNRAPHLGQVVTLPALGLGKPDMRTGRFVFCWNNIGRLVHDDGSRTCVSFGDDWATTQPAPAPRAWREGDAEPDDAVHALATTDGPWPYLVRAGRGGWFHSTSPTATTTGFGLPWRTALAQAKTPLSEVLPDATGGES